MGKRSRLIASLLVMLILLTYQAYSNHDVSQYRDERLPSIHADNENATKVRLITGDEVLIVRLAGKRIYAINPSSRSGGNFVIIRVGEEGFVIPSSLNERLLSILDVLFFNVEYLAREGYDTYGYWRVIVDVGSYQEIPRRINMISDTVVRHGGTVVGRLSLIPALIVKVPANNFISLAEELARMGVSKIWLDRKVYVTLSESVPLIEAPKVWELGFRGEGVRIAVVDTGIDKTHPNLDDLDDDPDTDDPKVIFEYVCVEPPYDAVPEDLNGHGTHVAGIAAGTGSLMGLVGVAPKAWLYNLKAVNFQGVGFVSWVLNCIEVAVKGPDGTIGTGDDADVINLSLGSFPTDGNDPLSRMVDRVADLGAVPVVAAGNSFNNFLIGSPGVSGKAITVGATTKEDMLAMFSSKGPTLDFRVKPDIVAPGVSIVSSVPGGTAKLSGTSMATPHVAGVVALLLQAYNFTLKPHQVKSLLVSTAKDLGLSIYSQGGGRVRAYEALTSEIAIEPVVTNLGLITKDLTLSREITFTNLRSSEKRLLISVKFKDSIRGINLDIASLSEDDITIPPKGSVSVKLTVNTSLPKSVYEGYIIAKDPEKGKEWKAMVGFARLNRITLTYFDPQGMPILQSPSVVIKDGYDSMFDFFLNTFRNIIDLGSFITSPNGDVTHIVSDGGFFFVAIGEIDEEQSTLFVIKETKVNSNIKLKVKAKETFRISFELDPKYILSSKFSGISYKQFDPNIVIGIQSGWLYPLTPHTYVTKTKLSFESSYSFYPKRDFNEVDPKITKTRSWAKLHFSEPKGISKDIVYKLDRLNIIVRKTYYASLQPNSKVLVKWVQATYAGNQFLSSFIWMMKVPSFRNEYLSSNVFYFQWLEKFSDKRGVITPYWLIHQRNEILGYVASGNRVAHRFGFHPVTTHIATLDDLIIGHLLMDSEGHALNVKATIELNVFKDGKLVLKDIFSGFHYFFQLRDDGNYIVEVKGFSDLSFPKNMLARFAFKVFNKTASIPPIGLIKIKNVDLNNNIILKNGKIVGVLKFISDSKIIKARLWFSLNDGEVWNEVKLKKIGINAFKFIIKDIPDNSIISLMFKGEEMDGDNVSQIIIRSFLAKTNNN